VSTDMRRHRIGGEAALTLMSTDSLGDRRASRCRRSAFFSFFLYFN
jgi:hypothetical protein